MNLNSFSVIYFTDGACSGNPGPGGWGLLKIDQPMGSFEESGAYVASTTNNRMELTAVLKALEDMDRGNESELPTLIILDSEYVRRGLEQWLGNWKKNGWKKSTGDAVLNQDLWQELDELWLKHRKNIEFKVVRGHAGVPGNERVDEIAVSFSQTQKCKLASGRLDDCGVDWKNLSDGAGASKKSKSKSKAPKNGYYLSLVKGELCRHDTWAECEARVKGVSGAKFKKVANEADEAATLSAWNYRSS